MTTQSKALLILSIKFAARIPALQMPCEWPRQSPAPAAGRGAAPRQPISVSGLMQRQRPGRRGPGSSRSPGREPPRPLTVALPPCRACRPRGACTRVTEAHPRLGVHGGLGTADSRLLPSECPCRRPAASRRSDSATRVNKWSLGCLGQQCDVSALYAVGPPYRQPAPTSLLGTATGFWEVAGWSRPRQG